MRSWTTSTPPYVDQWDWEKIITQEDRTRDYLKQTVNAIVRALVDTQSFLRSVFPQLSALPELPGQVTFVTAQDLEDLYPQLSPRSGRTPLSGSTVRCFSWGSAES